MSLLRYLCIVCTVLLLAGCSAAVKEEPAAGEQDGESLSSAEIKRVYTAPVVASDVAMVTNYPAVVRALQTTSLFFRVGGPLIEVNVESGALVKKGEVLMKIDPRDYHNDVATTKASLNAAEARLASMKVARGEDIRLLEASEAAAQAAKVYAQQELARYRRLFDEHTVTSSEFEAKQAEGILAEARLSSATEELAKARSGAREEDVAATVAEIRGLTTRLQIASDHLADTELIAPHDGIVIERRVSNYEIVPAREKCVVLMQDISKLKIDIFVAERELAQLAVLGTGANSPVAAEVVFNTYPARRFHVKIGEIVTAPDPNTQTYRVTFLLDLPTDITVFPGMTAEVFLSDAVLAGTASERALTVPAAAILGSADGESYVWKVDPATSRVTRATVKRGKLLSENRYIVHGLREGERVVTSGARFLAEGLTVRVEQGAAPLAP